MSKMNIKFQKLLDLSSSEVKILRGMGDKVSVTPSNLAVSIGIPRTTISFLLGKLAKRGMVERIFVKNHREWKLYYENISKLESLFTTDNLSLISQVKGIKGIERLCLKMLELRTAERIYYIQGSGSSTYALAKLDENFWCRFHEQVKKKKIILDGIAAESILDTFNGLSKAQLVSHKERMVIAYLLPDSMLKIPIDLFIFRDCLLVVDYKEEIGVSIKQKNIIRTLNLFIEMAKNFGRKMNLNEYISNLLAQK